MPRFGQTRRRLERGERSHRLAPAARRSAAAGPILRRALAACALLIGASCGRFGFETLPQGVSLPSVLDSGGSCNLGTLQDCSACGDDCARHGMSGVAELSCVSAVCGIASCAPGFANCNQDPSDGCEVALDSLANCGACNQPCAIANAETSCASGSCQLVQCAPGFGDCDGDIASNGCERPLNTLTNCGGCGVPCSLANGTTSCDTGVCQLLSCANGFDDCDGDPATGCETRLDTLTDCGSCGVPCDVAGGSSSCAGGVCSAASCAPFLADCDGDSLSCETDLRTLSSCVGCNVPCGDADGRLSNATASCAAGSCGVGSCDPGFGDCDLSPGNGCETTLNTLVDCGGCNVPCSRANGSESCASGACQTVSCDPGFDDCDGDDSTGCEAQLGTNAHCGGCNDTCGANQVCSGGSCVGQFITFQPANVKLASINSGTAPDVLLDCGTINLDTGSLGGNGWCGHPSPPLVVQTQQNGPDLVVVPMKSLSVAAGSTFRVLGSRPVALLVFGDVNVAGTIDVSANGSSGGAGNEWNCFQAVGTNGQATRSDGGQNGGGGGGAFGANGGNGGSSSDRSGGSGGQPRGSNVLSPLIPGCNGGWGGGCGAGPGGGGGAVELAASGRVDISGRVLARGADGVNGCDATGGATGGGSGGGILIQGNQVFHSGSLIAEGGRGGRGAGLNGGNGGLGGTTDVGQPGANGNGKGGGGGGGSTGRIRIAGAQGCSLTGAISPVASLSCP
jgi:hypothetical protein